VTPYAGFSILSLTLLYHRRVLDPVQGIRQKLSHALTIQFFGCFMSARFADQWLVRGLALSVFIFKT
jgi:hypothetical protein